MAAAAATAFCRFAEGQVDVFVRVMPNASLDAVEGVVVRDDGQARLAMRVRAVPEKGKANKAVVALLAKTLGLPKSALSVTSGETSRDKTVRIASAEGLKEALRQLAAKSLTAD
jgi:uncharacterized protein